MQLLKNVKVCDPAIGSGAFPMGILYVLYHAIHHLQSHAEPHGNFDSTQTKRDIIQNNIFGVDIEQGAVDIARLRFWLALVVDAEEPQPLPNLDYKIVCGNSILHRFSLDTSIEKVFVEYNMNRPEVDRMTLGKYKEKVYEFTNTSDHKKKDEFRSTIEQIKKAFRSQLTDWDKNKKRKLREQIRDLEIPLIFGKRTEKEKADLKKLKKDLAKAEKEGADIENNKIYASSFEWRFEFPALLDNEGKFTGFDIIIGNPPYGAKLSSIEKNIFKEYYSDVHMRTPETYCYFISLAFRLVNPDGIVSYIVPNNMFFQNENEKTRSLLLFSHQLIRAINLGDNTFENADVPTCIFIANAKKNENYEVEYSDYRKYNICDIEWNKNYESISTELIKTVPSYVLGLSSVNIRIINEIKRHGILIDSIAEEMASGISTGGDNIFKVNKDIINDYHIENQILYPVLVGSSIDKYKINNTNEYIIYTSREMDIEQYPYAKEYLSLFIDKLRNRSEAKKGILPWFSLNRNRYQKLFEEPKLIMRQTSDSIRCVYDNNGFYVLDSILVLKKNTNKYHYKYIATVLNSTLIDYLYKKLTQEEGRTFAQVKPINVRKLYIPEAVEEEQELLSILYDYLVFLKNPKQSEPFISLNSMFIDLFEKIIDGCVYELFFKEHMKEREIDIINHLYQKIIPIDRLSDEEKNNTIISVHSSIFMTDNPVRTRLKLFVSRSQEFLKPIIQH
jgi:adenine-specific DNA-methyltransferase